MHVHRGCHKGSPWRYDCFFQPVSVICVINIYQAPTPIVHVDVRNSNIFPEANKIQLDDLDNLIQELRFNVANRKAELDQESMINVQAVIDELDNVSKCTQHH